MLDRGMEGFVQSKPFRKMGIHSSRTGELFFSNVRLGRDRLLGETEDNDAGDGRASARSNFSAERIGVAAMSLGVIEECLRLCVDYAKNRTLWGQEIGQFQLIQLKLANMEVARMNVRNILFRVIESAEKGQSISLPEASAIKWYCSQAATDVAMEAVQVFGGNGYMTEYRVEQLARDAKSLMIYAGSNEVQITHVARGLLKAVNAMVDHALAWMCVLPPGHRSIRQSAPSSAVDRGGEQAHPLSLVDMHVQLVGPRRGPGPGPADRTGRQTRETLRVRDVHARAGRCAVRTVRRGASQ